MLKNSLLLTFLIFLIFSLSSCDPEEVSSNKSNLELISQHGWELDRFTSPEGETIQRTDLDQTAQLLFIMDFEFRENGEVRGTEKAQNNIVDRGVWEFVNDETAVNVKLSTLDYEFQIIKLNSLNLTLQAPTGNFLSGVGERINLEFSVAE